MDNSYLKLVIDLWGLNKKLTPALQQVLSSEHTDAIDQAIEELPKKDGGRMILIIERYYGIKRDKTTLAQIGKDLLQPKSGAWVREIKETGLCSMRVNPTLQPVAQLLQEAGFEGLCLETSASLPSPELMSSLLNLAAADKQQLPEEFQAIPICVLGLSERLRICFIDDSIDTLGDLLKKSPDELMRTPGFGRMGLQEVKEKLEVINLHLAQ